MFHGCERFASPTYAPPLRASRVGRRSYHDQVWFSTFLWLVSSSRSRLAHFPISIVMLVANATYARLPALAAQKVDLLDEYAILLSILSAFSPEPS